MHASAEPPPGAAGLAAAGSTAQLGAQHEQPDDLALAVAAQVSANDRIIAHWLDLCGRELERQYALAANKVDIWVWWPLDKAWYPGGRPAPAAADTSCVGVAFVQPAGH
jgi:hypothetical protein